ncbi:MAG: hypothetical protein JWO45_2136 [Spartobacteria bacterium]|nr:hypothetical protein [Spartobacteria bacterium]
MGASGAGRLGYAVVGDVSQNHDGIVDMRAASYVDGGAGDTRSQDRRPSCAGASIERHRFRDGHGAISGRIERIDFAAFSGFRDRARECFAGSGSAAWIHVVADAGNPSA